MINEVLSELFKREFNRLKNELEAYPNPDAIWNKTPGINNSAGNLALHLSGNLRYFIGAVLGSTGYERDRDFEFQGRVDMTELLDKIRKAEQDVEKTLSNLDNTILNSPYPIKVFGSEMTCYFFLTHLYGHFNYHLGQINYHRRLLNKR